MDHHKSEIFDFFIDKEECKVAEDNLRTALFSSNINSQKMFKEDYFANGLPLEWKTEPSDFSVDELLGSYFVEDDLHSGGPAPPSSGSEEVSGGGGGLSLKDDDFEPFRDLVSLPFDSVMDTLDPTLEAASDSGLSNDNLADMMLSPSSGATSPDPRSDISVDTLDAISDVSSTSDLGSLGSVGSSPNPGSGHSFPAIRLDLGGASVTPSLQDDVEMKDLCSSVVSERVSTYTAVPLSQSHPKPLLITPQTIAKFAASVSPSITTSQQPSITTRSIKVELGQSPRLVRPTTLPNGTATTRSPILTKVRLENSSGIVTTAPKISTVTQSTRTNSPQTIVVTQGGKANPLLKGSTLLKAGGGRSILLPVNVSDLNQVRTIKIISANANNGINKTGVSAGIRTLVSTVRPVGSSTTGTRATFYTTTKGPEGRSLLKVTPTALVSPTTHPEVVSRVSVTPSYIKDEPSDDEEVPVANQELVLTDEERKLMKKEGLVLPSRYPLTKQEERDLKRIRRKIRNKISAQDSRKRKKEYVDGLEDRVKNCTDDNQQLQKRIKTLEKQNESLLAQLKRFQNLVGGGIYYNKPHNHTSTALMMLILSAALFVVPSLRSQDSKGENELTRNNKMPSAGHSRSLLEARSSHLNLKDMDGGFLSSDDEELDSHTFSQHALSDHDYAPVTKQPRLDPSATLFSPPNVDKTTSRQNGDPPDSTGGLDGVAALIGAMLDRLGGNWTDPGGSSFNLSSGGALNRTPPHRASERASVVVNLNHGKRLRDDIELE